MKKISRFEARLRGYISTIKDTSFAWLAFGLTRIMWADVDIEIIGARIIEECAQW